MFFGLSTGQSRRVAHPQRGQMVSTVVGFVGRIFWATRAVDERL